VDAASGDVAIDWQKEGKEGWIASTI